MATDLRQRIFDNACPECGGKVVLRWSRSSKAPSGTPVGFTHARCQSCGEGWYAGHYSDFPVEEVADSVGWDEALSRLVASCNWTVQ
ncbi:MAG: hypothetical protein IJ781_04010 [Atopobiaceae bacterium]|nr:hypothetical protein [Atopobiaceae bacterium]